MWISLDVLVAALVNLCEFKVLILSSICTRKIPFTPSFHLILAINDIKIYCGGIMMETVVHPAAWRCGTK
jgi:hypothetical protein